jgi:hypothetical protein
MGFYLSGAHIDAQVDAWRASPDPDLEVEVVSGIPLPLATRSNCGARSAALRETVTGNQSAA